MPIHLDPRFQAYLDRLTLTKKSRDNYRQYVRWLEKYGLRPVTLATFKHNASAEQFIEDVARGYNADPSKHRKWHFNDQRKSDARTILNHYRNFLLSDPIVRAQEECNNKGEFTSNNDAEGKEKVIRSIALRRGQVKFRNDLLVAYGESCAMTGTTVVDALEAAHILPYNGRSTNHISNGLLLRCDLHTLFDLKLISIDPADHSIHCSTSVKNDPTYRQLHGQRLRLPLDKTCWPNVDAMRNHFESSGL